MRIFSRVALKDLGWPEFFPGYFRRFQRFFGHCSRLFSSRSAAPGHFSIISIVRCSNGEAAWYINHLDADVLVDPPVEMELAQGKMSVSRVWCKNCTRVVGWKFIECLSGGKNAHHCGRWGILEGRVKKVKLPEGKYFRNKT